MQGNKKIAQKINVVKIQKHNAHIHMCMCKPIKDPLHYHLTFIFKKLSNFPHISYNLKRGTIDNAVLEILC